MDKNRCSLRKWYPDTLIKKMAGIILGTAMLLLLLVVLLVPRWINQRMRPDRIHSVTVLSEGVATKISYILHQNTQYLLKFITDDNLLDEVLEQETAGWEDTGRIIGQLLPEYYGSAMEGAIHSTRNAVLTVDDSPVLCQEHVLPYAQAVLESSWAKSYQEEIRRLRDTSNQVFTMDYSEVLSCRDRGISTDGRFIALGMSRIYEGRIFVLYMIQPLADFTDILADLEEGGMDGYCVVGRDNRLLYVHPKESVFSEFFRDPLSTGCFSEVQYEATQTDWNGYLILGMRVSYFTEDLKIAACISEQALVKPFSNFVTTSMLIFTFFTILLTGAILLIVRRMLAKLQLLNTQMRLVQSGNYEVPRKIESRDEIGELADSFYRMMSQIQQDMQIIRQKEEREKKIDYSLLVSQIDPHFIYNTLNTITYLAELNCTKDIQIINCSLIHMLRDRLKTSRLHTFDTLEHELQQLKDYITIQKYLCSGELTLEVEVADEDLALQYPKNVLQPLVENSIVHGILVNRGGDRKLIPGVVQVKISRGGQELETVVRDNGVGMPEEKILLYFAEPVPDIEEESARGTENIAIYNIRRRMAYLYGESFSMTGRVPEDGKGLEIRLRFPVIVEKAGDEEVHQ